MRSLALVLAVLVAAPAWSAAGQARPDIDRSGKGAVLCVWALYDAALQAGEMCFPGEDPALVASLRDGLARIDRFILANSSKPVTQAQLDAFRTRTRRQNDAAITGGICRTDAVGMYQLLRKGGPAGVRASIDDLLSVPREPVLNPCV